MRDKILQGLKTKNSKYGLSQTILEVLADDLAKTVEKDEDVETAVTGVEGQMKIYQSFADQNRTLQTEITNLKKGAEGKTEEKKEEEKKKGGDDKKESGEQEPAWLKALNEKIDKQNDLISNFQKEKAQQSTAQQLQAKFTELKIPQSFQKLIPMDKVFATPEEMEAFVNEQKANYDGLAQEFGNAALGQVPKPLFGEAAKEGEVSPDVQARIDSKKPAKTNE
ncbi:MAG: hypothetical protein RSE50_00805 [Myroides sp.]